MTCVSELPRGNAGLPGFFGDGGPPQLTLMDEQQRHATASQDEDDQPCIAGLSTNASRHSYEREACCHALTPHVHRLCHVIAIKVACGCRPISWKRLTRQSELRFHAKDSGVANAKCMLCRPPRDAPGQDHAGLGLPLGTIRREYTVINLIFCPCMYEKEGSRQEGPEAEGYLVSRVTLAPVCHGWALCRLLTRKKAIGVTSVEVRSISGWSRGEAQSKVSTLKAQYRQPKQRVLPRACKCPAKEERGELSSQADSSVTSCE